MPERTRHEQETLIFNTAERAREFAETTGEQLNMGQRRAVRRDREIVAEAVAHEFTKEGHAVHSLKTPWQHSPAEHSEAQRLVDLSFSHDLPTALKAARQSKYFPRILDLFHDVLTSELYDAMREHKLNRQPLIGWSLLAGIVILAGILLMALIVALN